MQDAFGAVLSNVPDAQIREEAAEWIKNDLGVTALVVLPVAAITGGLAVASDLDRKSLEEWTSNPENLAILGKEKAVELAALPLEQRLPAMREAWDAQDKADRLEWLKQRAEIDRELAAAGMAIESGEKADAGRYGVAVRYDGKAWSVTLGDGSSVQADSEEAARRIRSDLMLTHRRAEADALVAAIEAWHAGKPGTDAATTLTAETVTAGKDGLTFTDRRRGVITREITNGQAVEEAAREAALLNQQSGDSEVTAIVNGSNAVQKVADGVRGVVQRLELYRGDKPLAWTFLHESLEADWQAGVQAGVFTLEGTRAAAGSLARFIDPARVTDPDERRLAENLHALARGEGDATMLRETVTEFAMRDVVGRGRYGRGDSDPGSFSRIIADAIGQAQSREEARGLSRLAAWFRSVRAWLASVLGTVRQIQKARGKQGFTEWESHMETLLGISDQGRYDAELAAEIEAQANQDTYTAREPTQEEMEAGMVFSLTPSTPERDARTLTPIKIDTAKLEGTAGDMRRLDGCMDELEPDRAAAVRGAYLDGESYADLASRHRVPLNTMRTWLRRSLMRLKECMER